MSIRRLPKLNSKSMLAAKRFSWLVALAALTLGACGASERREALAEFPASALTDPSAGLVLTPPTPPPPSPAQDSKPAATPPQNTHESDQVNKLLDRADKLYQAGVKDYGADKLDAAKVEFDQAVGLLLESGLDIQSDD